MTNSTPAVPEPPDKSATSNWAYALLIGLARDEAAGRRPIRVTEPRLATWARFKGRLSYASFVELLFEDAAVTHPIPFDPVVIAGPLEFGQIADAEAENWLNEVTKLDLKQPGAEYVISQASRLGIPTRLARTDLHVVKSHQKVLELPGTGGQLAHYLVSTHPELSLATNFTVACSTWQELTLAGIVGLDFGSPSTDFAVRTTVTDMRDPKHPLRQRSYDYVVGLHPSKGGALQKDEQLAIWFSGAKILLV